MASQVTLSPLSSYPPTKAYIDEDMLSNNLTGEAGGDHWQRIQELQTISLWVMFCIGLPGNLTVIVWIYVNLRRRSRINTIVLGLASADLMVCFFGILANAVYIPIQHNFLCKIFYFCMGISLMGSPNMVIVMAIDRHQAVIYPLKKFAAAWKLVLMGWSIAVLLASPQLFVWALVEKGGVKRCGTTFNPDSSGKLIYILYIAVVTFLIPLILICYAYLRISLKIWVKAQEHSGKNNKKGKVNLKRSGNKSLSKAKVKTLKMTIVIIFFFVICTLPYFVIEVIRFIISSSSEIRHIYGICSTLAVSNSAINPYIFLAFNLTKRFWNDFMILVGRNCPPCRGRYFRGTDNSFKSVRFSSSNSKMDPSSRGVTFVSRVNQETSIVPDDDVDSL